MQTEATERYLHSFGKYVVQQARSNLTKAGKSDSKGLYNSIKYEVVRDGDNFILEFYMLSYGKFVDKGVSGSKKTQNYKNWEGRNIPSPYKFGTGSSLVGKSKGGMSGIMSKWVARKGFQWRDKETGKFMSHKSMGYIIARSIYSKGIKSISFFQRPIELGLKTFGQDLLDNVAKDLIDTVNNQSTTTE